MAESEEQPSAQDLLHEFKRYEETVTATGVLKLALNSSKIGCPDKCICIGGTLKRVVGSKIVGELTPDLFATLSAQEAGLMKSVIFEIKWDISGNTATVRNELADLKRHFDNLSGFPCRNKLSIDHDIGLVVNRDNASQVKVAKDELLKSEPDGYSYLNSDRFAILSWDRVVGKLGDDKYRAERVTGNFTDPRLVNCFSNPGTCEIELIDIFLWRARVFAVADAPSRVYAAFQLMRALGGLFNNDPRRKEIVIAEEKLYEVLTEKFRPLTPVSPPQISKESFNDTLADLISIRYNVFIEEGAPSDSSEVVQYKILNKTPNVSNLADWLAEKFEKIKKKKEVGKKKLQKSRKVRPTSKALKNIVKLDRWS